ncbi:metallophosphoesterase [Acidaminococcus sp. HCP3S3_H5]|uniref:metallophosphoesterase n=1 Tax=Acidaminococcus sp. HCP3S3_H5 TaxID=3438733 RepID=UPI003F8F2252
MKKNVSIKKSRILMGFLALAVALVAGVWHFSPWFRTWALGKVDQARGAAIHYDLLDQVEARNIRQVMTADPSRSRVIQWQSDYPVKEEPVLEYRKAGESSLTADSVTEEKFTDGDKDTWIYTARLEQLEPGQAYEYRIRAGKKATEWMPLKAFAGNTFKALIFPDSQSADYSVWKAAAQPAWQRNPDASFFVNMGDLVDNGEDSSQWNAWFGVVEPMAEKIPVAPLMGNHETYDLNWKVRMPEGYLHRFALPDNGREKYRNQFYSFTVGDVHFVVLNTQNEELKEWEPDLARDQEAWFQEDMVRNRGKWNIVLMHKDPLQYAFDPATRPGRDRAEGFSPEGREWMPLFDRYGVDLVLSAHLHTYRNRGKIYDFQRADHGPSYIITGVAGDVRYPSLWKRHALDVTLAPQPETDNYLVLEKQEDQLRIQCFLPDGTLVDTVTIGKSEE